MIERLMIMLDNYFFNKEQERIIFKIDYHIKKVAKYRELLKTAMAQDGEATHRYLEQFKDY